MTGPVTEPAQAGATPGVWLTSARASPADRENASPPQAATTRRGRPLQLAVEPPADERAARRQAAQRLFRLYCYACGRSGEQSTVAPRPGRCPHCGGTQLVEVAPD